MRKIAVFISGTGSNARKLLDYFLYSKKISVALIVSNSNHSPFLSYAKKRKIRVEIIDKKSFNNVTFMLSMINGFDLVVLAGFVWLIPEEIISFFSKKIINIHPALLPKYGGIGMYGINVHKAVFLNKEKISGITIHYVNKKYDDGEIIFQKTCDISNLTTPEEVQEKVLALEHKHYSKVIKNLLLS